MKKILSIFRRKSVYWGVGAATLVLVGIFLFKNGGSEQATIVAQRADFINQVSVSGKIITANDADLGFASSGRIGRIMVKNGDSVRAGVMLAQLEIGDLLADLKIKEVNSRQENTEVESAYRTLLSEGLELTPESSNYTADTPLISGLYDGPEGQYKIRIFKENVTTNDLSFRTFGLEKTENEIEKEGSTKLGTHGLYITFPDELDAYNDTTWYLDIPNKSSSSYLENYNAYTEAKEEFEMEQAGGVSSVVQAEIDKIRADIRKSTIYAPFNGIITDVAKEIGETASSNEAVVSMIGTGTFQIESFVPEVNIALIQLGHEAQVTLDAYGEKEVFNATVVSIDPAETTRDGVSTYKVVLQFSQKDERIKAGMTANVSVIIFQKPAAIAVPGGVVFEEDGKKFVQIKQDDKIEKREVVLGDVSSLGQVEIISGIEEGEEIVLDPKGAADTAK